MADDTQGARVEPAEEGSDAVRRQIEALMRQPPKDPPSIIVVGDEHVFGITPPKP